MTNLRTSSENSKNEKVFELEWNWGSRSVFTKFSIITKKNTTSLFFFGAMQIQLINSDLSYFYTQRVKTH